MNRVMSCLALAVVLLLVGGRVLGERPAGQSEDPSDAPVLATEHAAEAATTEQGFDGNIGDLLLLPEPYYYESLGRRDLFVSLVSEEGEPAEQDAAPGSGELQVVGILWSENDRFALVETGDGQSLLIREGARLGDGTVFQVLPDRIVVHVTQYGTSRTVTLPLVQGGSFNENPRSRSR